MERVDVSVMDGTVLRGKEFVRKAILLTGGTGFFGSNLLARICTEPDIQVILLKRSSSRVDRVEPFLKNVIVYDFDRVNVSDIFRKHAIDTIIHTATDYGGKQIQPSQLIAANLTLPLLLLEAAHVHKVRCFINTDTTLTKKINHYALSKKQFLDWLHLFSNQMICINIALEYLYGCGDNPTRFLMSVIHSLLKKKPVLELTAGDQRRDFIYIDDVVRAFLLILKNSQSQTLGFYEYEVGSGVVVSIKELVYKIQQLIGAKETEIKFGALPYRNLEVMCSSVELTEIKKLGWSPAVSLEAGLRKTIEFEKSRLLSAGCIPDV